MSGCLISSTNWKLKMRALVKGFCDVWFQTFFFEQFRDFFQSKCLKLWWWLKNADAIKNKTNIENSLIDSCWIFHNSAAVMFDFDCKNVFIDIFKFIVCNSIICKIFCKCCNYIWFNIFKIILIIVQISLIIKFDQYRFEFDEFIKYFIIVVSLCTSNSLWNFFRMSD